MIRHDHGDDGHAHGPAHDHHGPDHAHGHDHGHAHPLPDSSRAFAIGIVLNLGFVALEAGGGLATGSLTTCTSGR